MQNEFEVNIAEDGIIEVAGQHVGHIEGLRFVPVSGSGKHSDKALWTAAEKALHAEFQSRMTKMVSSDEDLILENDSQIHWKGQSVAKLVKGRDILHPQVQLFLHETIDAISAEKLKAFLTGWTEVYLAQKLSPLFAGLRSLDEDNASGSARGVLFQVVEDLGVMQRARVEDLIKGLSEVDKKVLAKAGMRLGKDYLFFQGLLKPAAQRVNAILWKVWNEKTQYSNGFATEGKMSFAVERGVPRALYLVQGYALAGTRAIRVDVVERFTAKLREIARQDKGKPQPLPLDLLSIAGLKRDEAEEVFSFLGFKVIKETQSVTQGEETKEVEVLMIRPKFKKQVKKAEVQEVKIDESSPFSALAALKLKK